MWGYGYNVDPTDPDVQEELNKYKPQPEPVVVLFPNTAETSFVRDGSWRTFSPSMPQTTTAPPLPCRAVPGTIRLRRGDGQIVVRWAPPADDGGAAITAYTLRYQRYGAVTATNPYIYHRNIEVGARSFVLDGLVNGQGYTLHLWTENGHTDGRINHAKSRGVTPTGRHPHRKGPLA